MRLKDVGGPGTRIAVVLAEFDCGREWYSAAVGTLGVTGDGHAYIVTDEGRQFESWELRDAVAADTELGAALARTTAGSMREADIAVRRVLADLGGRADLAVPDSGDAGHPCP